uniref:NADH-ubiquinone oxidoreductase chain 3 n=1 Tax=Paracatonidia sp. SX-2018 TaxID=2507540 RepID=A0A565D7D7_9HEMI|nr:NADH dehydrogenase subunit 3 [Paracatonidia sp. SX-2018]
MKILTTTLILVMIMMTMFLLTSTISKKTKTNREKSTPFECGFSPLSSPRNSFSTHFFLMAMMFLIFDIEISLILPMYSTNMIKLNEWIVTSTIVMLILMYGLYHEWLNKMLEWTK